MATYWSLKFYNQADDKLLISQFCFGDLYFYNIFHLWNVFDALSFDDIDGNCKWRQDRETDCQSNTGLHANIKPFVCIYTFLG